MPKTDSVGVVIGRFQLPELHEGHRHLIDHVRERHGTVLVLCGHNDVRFTTANPFPLAIQKQVVQSAYPDVLVDEIADSKVSPVEWSQRLDDIINEVADGRNAMLYGSRDSFADLYSGKFPVQDVPQVGSFSATEVREEFGKEILDDPVFRHGWLAAIMQQYAVTDPTVDVAIVRPDFSEVLMGRRGKLGPLRFIGGFTDPTDDSYEDAALRERAEEMLGIEVGEPEYIGSKRINDKRYKNTPYGIMTTFFAMQYISGEPKAGDDMEIAEWVPLTFETKSWVTPTHHWLFDMLLVHATKVTQ